MEAWQVSQMLTWRSNRLQHIQPKGLIHGIREVFSLTSPDNQLTLWNKGLAGLIASGISLLLLYTLVRTILLQD